MTNSFFWGLAQLESAARVERKKPMFNPRPAGVIQAGSASEAILKVLRASPEVFFTHGALLRLTGRSHAAVSWGLKYLRCENLIRTVGDEARNSKYLRYAAAVGARDVEIAIQSGKKARKKRLGNDEAPMPGTGLQGLSELRGTRHQGLSAVAEELRAVLGGHWTATEPEALAGQAGHLEALHPGKRDLDRAHAANEPAPVLPQGDRGGPDADSGRGCTVAGTADTQHGAAPLGRWLQPGEPAPGQARQALDLQAGHAHRCDAKSDAIPRTTRDLFHPLETIRAAA